MVLVIHLDIFLHSTCLAFKSNNPYANMQVSLTICLHPQSLKFKCHCKKVENNPEARRPFVIIIVNPIPNSGGGHQPQKLKLAFCANLSQILTIRGGNEEGNPDQNHQEPKS